MAKGVRRSPSRLKTPGARVGTKKRDMRWEVDGEVYDSRFEYEVLQGLTKAGLNVRRTNDSDSIPYTRPVRNGVCSDCGSNCVASAHSYTPDAYVSSGKGQPDPGSEVQPAAYYLEVKGYMRADRRSLLRALRKARPDVDLRFIIQRDYRVTKSLSLAAWIVKYLKCPVIVWNGSVPHSWA